jgi:hypothetical protein
MSIAAGSVSSRTSGGKKDGKSFADVDEGVDVDVADAVDARRSLEERLPLARRARGATATVVSSRARRLMATTHERARSFADRSSVRRGRAMRRRVAR